LNEISIASCLDADDVFTYSVAKTGTTNTQRRSPMICTTPQIMRIVVTHFN
jgi:hypothetical protein